MMKNLYAYLLLVLVPLIWSGSILVADDVSVDPAINIAFWRWLLVVGLLLPFTFKRVRQEWPIIKAHWRILSLLALFGVAIASTCALQALHDEDLINAGLINGATPIFIVILSAICYRTVISWSKIAGIILGFVAVLLLVLKGNFFDLQHVVFKVGDIWMLASVLAWAIYSLLLKHQPAGMSLMSFLVVISFIGVLCLLPWFLWNLAHGIEITVTHMSKRSLLYVALLTSIVGYLGWNKGVNVVGAERAGFFLNLYPIFAMLLSVIFFSTPIYWYDTASLVLILIGLYLVGRKS